MKSLVREAVILVERMVLTAAVVFNSGNAHVKYSVTGLLLLVFTLAQTAMKPFNEISEVAEAKHAKEQRAAVAGDENDGLEEDEAMANVSSSSCWGRALSYLFSLKNANRLSLVSLCVLLCFCAIRNGSCPPDAPCESSILPLILLPLALFFFVWLIALAVCRGLFAWQPRWAWLSGASNVAHQPAQPEVEMHVNPLHGMDLKEDDNM